MLFVMHKSLLLESVKAYFKKNFYLVKFLIEWNKYIFYYILQCIVIYSIFLYN